MTDYADTRALEIASMIDEKQQAVAIRAYGDQRAREALDAAMVRVDELHGHPTQEIVAGIRALIPKKPCP